MIPLDTNAYDLPALMQSRAVSFYEQVFGDDPAAWKDASPSQHIAQGKGIPPFLVCYSRGMRARVNPERPKRANEFTNKLAPPVSPPRSSMQATGTTGKSTSGSGERTTQWSPVPP